MMISTLLPRFSESSSSSSWTIFKIHRHKNIFGHVLLVNINLLQQRGEEFAGIETLAGLLLRQVFPEEFAAIKNFSAAQMEDIHGEHLVFKVVAEDVLIVAFNGGHALLFLQLLHG